MAMMTATLTCQGQLSWRASSSKSQRDWAARPNMLPDSPQAGVTNYYLPVYGSDCHLNPSSIGDMADHCVPLLILWFFDSRGGFEYQQKDAATEARVGKENWVDASVLTWFETTQANFAGQVRCGHSIFGLCPHTAECGLYLADGQLNAFPTKDLFRRRRSVVRPVAKRADP